MELPDADRLILLNLFEIREALAGENTDDAKHWAFCADIVRFGYESLYDKLPSVHPRFSKDRGQLAREIADMYVVLGDYLRDHPDDKGAQEHPRAQFGGFDGNGDDNDLMGFLRFVMERNGEFPSLAEQRKKTDGLNSHGAGPSVSEYGAMVSAWKSSRAPRFPETTHCGIIPGAVMT